MTPVSTGQRQGPWTLILPGVNLWWCRGGRYSSWATDVEGQLVHPLPLLCSPECCGPMQRTHHPTVCSSCSLPDARSLPAGHLGWVSTPSWNKVLDNLQTSQSPCGHSSPALPGLWVSLHLGKSDWGKVSGFQALLPKVTPDCPQGQPESWFLIT